MFVGVMAFLLLPLLNMESVRHAGAGRKSRKLGETFGGADFLLAVGRQRHGSIQIVQLSKGAEAPVPNLERDQHTRGQLEMKRRVDYYDALLD